MPQELKDVFSMAGDAATVLAAVVAAISAILILIQIRSSAQITKASIAIESHRDYIRLCIERPELSCSDTMLRYLKRRSFDGILDEVSEETERALWFLSFGLNAMEQIFETSGNATEWNEIVAGVIGHHELLVREVWPHWRSHYAPDFQAFVNEALVGLER